MQQLTCIKWDGCMHVWNLLILAFLIYRFSQKSSNWQVLLEDYLKYKKGELTLQKLDNSFAFYK